MSKRTDAQKLADTRYRVTHQRVKLCNADSTPANKQRLNAVCEKLSTTQENFILQAVTEAERIIEKE